MNKFRFFKIATVAFLGLLLASCSSTNQAYFNTLKLAFKANQSQQVTLEMVRQSQADLLQVQIGEKPTALMALGFIENNLNKWVSADNAIIKIHHGVIVATEGFEHDLLYTSNVKENPLTDTAMVNFSWQRQVDIASVGYGLVIEGQWRIQQNEAISILEQSFDTRKITEQVTFPKTGPYIDTQTQWQNTYWVNSTNGELLKASVKIMPQAPRIQMTYVSRAARYIAQQEASQ